MNKLKFILYLLIVALPVSTLAKQAEEVLVISDSSEAYSLNNYLQYFCDTTSRLKYEDVKTHYSGQFTKKELPYLETEKKEKYYWIKVTIQNNSEKRAWYIESWGFDIDQLEFYSSDMQHAMGYSLNFNLRPIYHKNLNALVQIERGEKKTIYLRLQRTYPMHPYFYIRSDAEFMKHLLIEYFLLALFYGTLGLIVILNLFLFFRLKERIHLFYLFCIGSEILYCFGRDGLGFQFLWPSHPSFNLITHFSVTQVLLIVSTLLYSIKFLDLKKWNKKLYFISIAAIFIKCLITFFSFFLLSLTPFTTFVIDSLILTIPFISGIIAYKQKVYSARFYVLANAALFVSFLIIFLDELFPRMLPFYYFNWYMINIGIFLEAIFLAVALLDQIGVYRKKTIEERTNYLEKLNEKSRLIQEANKELEQQIHHRTADIRERMKNIEMQNQEMDAMNLQFEQINSLLEQNNEELESSIIDLSRLKILVKEVKFDEFKTVFPDESTCLRFLHELKWKNGYACRKCGYRRSIPGLSDYALRCKACDYNESATAQTLFHGIRIDLTKAFYLVYLLANRTKELSIDEVASTLSLNKELIRLYKERLDIRKHFFKVHGYEHQNWSAYIYVDKSVKK